MERRIHTLLFEYQLFYNLLKYSDPTNKKEYSTLSSLVYNLKQNIQHIIEYSGKNSEHGYLLRKNINTIEVQALLPVYDINYKKKLYEDYLNCMADNTSFSYKYKLINGVVQYNEAINSCIYTKKSNKNYLEQELIEDHYGEGIVSLYELVIGIVKSKFFLFVLGLSIIITIIFCIIVNSTSLVDSISEHGTISNMVDLHSAFAISTKVIVIISFIFCLVLIVTWLISYNVIKYRVLLKNYLLLNLGQLYFTLYIISLIYSIYFIFTGFVWADFTWGGRIWKFEGKMIQLWIHIFLNLLFCYVFFFHRRSSFFSIINLIILSSIVAFVFFSLYDNLNQPYSVHQTTDSLHLFLRFVGAGTGYYVVFFVFYLFFIMLSCILMVYELQRLKIKNLAHRFLNKSTNLY